MSPAIALRQRPRRRALVAVGVIALALIAHLAIAVLLSAAVARPSHPAPPPAEAIETAPPPMPEIPPPAATPETTVVAAQRPAPMPPPSPPLPALAAPTLAPPAPTAPALDPAALAPDPLRPALLPAIAVPTAASSSIAGALGIGAPGGAVGELVSQDALDRQPRQLSQPLPMYPPRALRAGLTDTVTVRFTIGVDGRAHDIEVVHAEHPEVFGPPTVAAVLDGRFVPAQRGGAAVPATMLWVVRYVLPR